MVSALFLTLGVAMLFGGGELLVRGASGVARALRVSPLIIGLTIVAFGTSAPELVVNLVAVLQGSSGVAFGNVIGSNLATSASSWAWPPCSDPSRWTARSSSGRSP